MRRLVKSMVAAGVVIACVVLLAVAAFSFGSQGLGGFHGSLVSQGLGGFHVLLAGTQGLGGFHG